jgi:hypothetical protein
MYVIIGLAATILFIILWRSGILEDLMERGGIGEEERRQRDRKRLSEAPLDPEMAKRLEVFEEFLEELPDDEDE